MQIFDHAGQVGDVLNFIQRHRHRLACIQTAIAKKVQHQVVIALLEHGALIQPFQVEVDSIGRGDLLQQPFQAGGFSCAAHARDDDGALVAERVF